MNEEFWAALTGDVTLTVYQKLNDETLVDSIAHWENNYFVKYPVPKEFTFAGGTSEVLRGAQKTISNQKYIRWNDIDDITNHHVFQIGPGTADLTSWFEPTQSGVVIKNFLSGGDGGTIEFKDPWFIDYHDPTYGDNLRNRGMDESGLDSLRFWSRSSPFSPDFTTPYENGQEYLGVFLNQVPDPTNPEKVYYSVRAPQSQTISFHGQPIAWYFQYWNGDDADFQDFTQTETAVVFQQPDAEARALYKGHFVSSNSEATGANNGRRMARDGEGTLHAVYEDGGRVWYTYTDNGHFGQVWVKEEMVETYYLDLSGEHFYQYINPSITEYNGTLHFVYTEVYYHNGQLDNATVLYRWKYIGEDQWEDSIYVYPAGFPISEISMAPKPAIEIVELPESNYRVVISFNRPDEPSQIKTYHKKLTDFLFSESSSVITGNNPSLSRNAIHNGKLGLCYEDEGEIYRCQWQGSSWSSANLVSGDTWVFSERTPNLSYYANESHVVWAGMGDELIPYVIYRSYKSGPGTPYYFEAGTGLAPFSHPTIAVTNDNPTIFYEETDAVPFNDMIVKRWFNGEDWLEKTYEQGRFPNIVVHGQSDAVWTKDYSVPYRLKTDYEIPDGESIVGRSDVPDTLIVNKRFDFTFRHDTTSGYLTLEIQNLRFGKRRITLDDSLLRSRPVIIPPNVPGEYTLMCRFKNVNFPVDTNAVLFRMEFAIGNTNHNIRQLRLADLLPYNDGQYHYFQRCVPLDNLTGKSGRFKIVLGNMTPIVSNMVVRQDSLSTRQLALLPGTPGKSEGAVELPKSYRLHQNYPNPFNPTTTITFDLPQNSFVELEIFDMSGRKVRTLINNNMDAGSHQSIWDGQDEFGNQTASGIYFSRIKANSGKGAFTAVNKMILLR